MGMAASQARFLSLTARKSNVEYEGQQINQQRTTLSNQSANLYNQMLTLSVPTPPSSDNFSTIQYTFTVPNTKNSATINQITKVSGSDDEYTISFSYVEEEIGFPACSNNHKATVNSYDADNHTANITTYKGVTTDLTYYDPANPDKTHTDAYNALCFDSEGNEVDTLYIVDVGTEASPSYQYFRGSEIDTALSTGEKCVYYEAGSIEVFKRDTYTPCTINRDANNRVTSFTYKDEELAVTTSTIIDEDAYNDAYNEYVYATYLYEQQMSEINAQTSVIQEQDKTLELRLKQLDTEHNAIQTEMEAISSIIQKNTEDTFKTFA